MYAMAGYMLKLALFALIGATLLLVADAPALGQTPTPTPDPGPFTLTTNVQPAGAGSLPGAGSYNRGGVSITAVANYNYRFDRFSGDCTGDGATSPSLPPGAAQVGTCHLNMNQNRSVTAHFVVVASPVLTTTASPSEGGGVSWSVGPWASVPVTASPNAGFRFDRWSGACTGSGACTVAMTADRSVTAHFVARHTLTASADPSGHGSVSGGGTYDAGTRVTVTASPNSGYGFSHWTGDCTGSGACSVTMSAARSVTAHFVPTFTLTGSADPSEGGSVTSGAYNSGAAVTVVATPSLGYAFERWSGDCTGTGACTVTMSAARAVTAHFVVASTHTLSASADPVGGGTVTGGGAYNAGSVVAVTATPGLGYRFVEWSGDCSGSGACSVTMSADRSVTAKFATAPTSRLIARAQPADGGSVTGGGTYNRGSVVAVTATANGGYRFSHWTGACTGSGACSVTMDHLRLVVAVFVARHTLTTSVSAAGGGTVSAGGAYDAGTAVTVTATPNSGYVFSNWTGACTGSGACSVTMNAARAVTAHFARGYNLIARATPVAGGTVSGGGTYASGARPTVTATPNTGYRLTGWAGECSEITAGACIANMIRDRTVTAHFVRTYALITGANPSVGGSVSGGGHVRQRERCHGHGQPQQRLPLRPLGRRLQRLRYLHRDHERAAHRDGALRQHRFRRRLPRHRAPAAPRGDRERHAGARRQRQVRRRRPRHHHRHAGERLPLPGLDGRLRRDLSVHLHGERPPPLHGALRRALRAHRERRSIRRGHGHWRRHVRRGGEGHGHCHGEHGLPLRPLVGRLHGFGNLLRDHERRPFRDGGVRAPPHAHRQRRSIRGGDRHRRGCVRHRDGRHGHGHGEQRLPLLRLVGRLHGHGRVLRDHERGPLRDRHLRRPLHARHQRRSRRRGDGQRRGRARRRDGRHGHGHAQRGLPLRALGGRLHGHGYL